MAGNIPLTPHFKLVSKEGVEGKGSEEVRGYIKTRIRYAIFGCARPPLCLASLLLSLHSWCFALESEYVQQASKQASKQASLAQYAH